MKHVRSRPFCTLNFFGKLSFLKEKKKKIEFCQNTCGNDLFYAYVNKERLYAYKCHIFNKRFVKTSNYFLQYLNNTCVAHRLLCNFQVAIHWTKINFLNFFRWSTFIWLHLQNVTINEYILPFIKVRNVVNIHYIP